MNDFIKPDLGAFGAKMKAGHFSGKAISGMNTLAGKQGLLGLSMGTTLRYAGAAGFGIAAIGQANNTYQRLKYGNVGGAMMSAGMGAAAAYGAYKLAMPNQAIRQHLGTGLRKLEGKLASYIR